MNYLAHLYLSGESEDIILGNFIGDYIKGNKFNRFPEEVARGILLHRHIDSFTDTHSLTRENKVIFRSEFGLYSGIVVDFFYDHFLAKNWQNYSDISLRTFAKKMHAIFLSNYRLLPHRVQGFLPFLIQNKRLESYASVEGIIQSLKIMGKYSSLPSKSETAKHLLVDNYDFMEDNFIRFMDDVMNFVDDQHGIKIKKPGLQPLIKF